MLVIEACLQYKGRVADPAAEVNWGRGSRGPKGSGLRPQEGSSLPPPPKKKFFFEQMKQNIVLSLPGIFLFRAWGGGGGAVLE